MERKELVRQPEYWAELVRNELFRLVSEYMTEHLLDKAGMAVQLGCSPQCLDEILDGGFNGTLGDFMKISVAIGKVPVIAFKEFDKLDLFDKTDRVSALIIKKENEEFVSEVCKKYNLTYYYGECVYAPADMMGDLKCARTEISKKMEVDEIQMLAHHLYFRFYSTKPIDI